VPSPEQLSTPEQLPPVRRELVAIHLKRSAPDPVDTVPSKRARCEEVGVCCICFQDAARHLKTVCGHVYCLECFERWDAEQRDAGRPRHSCAVCRKSVEALFASQTGIRGGAKVRAAVAWLQALDATKLPVAVASANPPSLAACAEVCAEELDLTVETLVHPGRAPACDVVFLDLKTLRARSPAGLAVFNSVLLLEPASDLAAVVSQFAHVGSDHGVEVVVLHARDTAEEAVAVSCDVL
jgi:hypothetical protein